MPCPFSLDELREHAAMQLADCNATLLLERAAMQRAEQHSRTQFSYKSACSHALQGISQVF